MKFREIFAFEIRYQLRSASTWIYLAVGFLFPLFLSSVSHSTDGELAPNAPSFLILLTVFTGIILTLATSSIAGSSAARDVQSRMQSLIYAAPVSKFEYLGARFLAAILLNAIIHLAIPIAFVLSFFIKRVDPSLLAPFRFAPYLTTYFYLSLPLAFIATACQFAIAVLDRRVITAYIVSVLIFPVTSLFIGTSVAKWLENWEIMKLFDLVGISIVGGMDAWTTYEKNNRLIQLEGTFLWNRVLWLGFAAVLLTFTYVRFKFAHHTPVKRWSLFRTRKRGDTSPSPNRNDLAPSALPEMKSSFSIATQLRQTLAVAATSFRFIARSKTGLPVVGFIALQFALFGYEYLQFRGVPQYASTMNVLTFLTASLTNFQTPLIIIPMLITFYAGELVWREREAGISKITDAAPVAEWSQLVGKLCGLYLMTFSWLLMLFVAGLFIQSSIDQSPIEIPTFLQAFFVFQISDYLLFGMLAIFVHVLIDQKYLAHGALLGLYLLITFHAKLEIEHKLLVFASDPGWSYTAMRGFDPHIQAWTWFTIYWIGWAILLGVAGRLLWVRSVKETMGMRLRLMRQRITVPTLWMAGVGGFIIAGAGSYVFYNANVLNEYRTAKDEARRAVRYETNYSLYKDIAQPVIVSTKLHLDLFPSERRGELKGSYQLVNKTDQPITTVHLTLPPNVKMRQLKINLSSNIHQDDSELGYRIYNLDKTLRPGDSLQIEFDIQFLSQGFTNSGVSTAVISNGSYIVNYDWLPAIGYQTSRELTDDTQRKKHGLTPREIPSLYDAAANKIHPGQELISFEASVSTEAGQIAIAPGKLVERWTSSDQGVARNHFRYATSAPIRNTYSLFSGRYAEVEDFWSASPDTDSTTKEKRVAIRVYHHPGHKENVERIVESAKASLTYFTEKFGPYPYDHLTIIERSGYSGELNAEPTAIDYGESFPQSNVTDNAWALDLIYFAVAHEVAHQWWGAAQLLPAHVEGGILVSETLANYSGLKVLEARYGEDQVRKLLDMWRDSYEVPRVRYTPPLIQAVDAFLGYRKGPLALFTITQYGDEKIVNDALRQLIVKHGKGELPLATSLDLYRNIKASAPDSLQFLLHDLFEKNIYWQLKMVHANARQNENGDWTVTLKVDAQKVTIDSTGVEVALPMNEWVEIGLIAPYVEGQKAQKPLYLKKHLIKSGEQTIIINMKNKPGRAAIDPNFLLLDLNPDNNVRNVTVEGARGGEIDLI